ncbi:MAG: septum formation initiator family protein [Deltaproteobacteria bacterium]|nr:septum formation initiator family protein [Deltaproteobacteria bacterium]
MVSRWWHAAVAAVVKRFRASGEQSRSRWLDPLPVVGLLIIGIFGWLIIFGDQGLLTWRALSNTQADLSRDETRLTEKVHALELEIERLEDPYYLEPIIRRELGYVRPGETVFQFPEDDQ